MLTSPYVIVVLFYFTSASQNKDDYKNSLPKYPLDRLLSNIIDVSNKRMDGIKHLLTTDDLNIAGGYTRSHHKREHREPAVAIYVINPKFFENNPSLNYLLKDKTKYDTETDTDTDSDTDSSTSTDSKEETIPLYQEPVTPYLYDRNMNIERQWTGCRKSAMKSCRKACKKATSNACREYKCKKGLKKMFKSECKSACKKEFGRKNTEDDDKYSDDV